MEAINDLLLLAGNDIPFRMGRCSIHPPKISEIAYIGEDQFHIGSRFLNFNKDSLSSEDKIGLENKTNFDIFMSVLNNPERAKHKTDALLVLTLIFPNFEVEIGKKEILLHSDKIESSINQYNFDELQSIVSQMFCLQKIDGNNKYIPADNLAKKVAEKLNKGRQKASQSKGEDVKKINLFSRYASILSIGLKMDINIFMNYTVYQLLDTWERFRLNQDFELYKESKLAGAKDVEEVKDWMEDLHP